MSDIPSFIFIIGSLLAAFGCAFVIIPTIITVVKEKNLYDEPNERGAHVYRTPTLGGVGIFISIMIVIPLFANDANWSIFRYLISAMIIIFAIGIKDDILVISASKKMIGQLVAAFLLTVFADARVSHLHGFNNITEIPYWTSILLSMLIYIVIINAYNFIDGIDGLAASIGILNALTFGTWFYLRGELSFAILSFSLAGALIAFFWFNVYSKKYKIFMGDTGSLMVGLLIAFMAIKFNEMNISKDLPYSVYSTPSVTFAVMALPIYDFFRIIFVRLVLKRKLMQADRLHLHHRILRLGLAHRYVTYWLVGVSLLFVIFGFAFQHISIRRLLLIEILLAMVLSYIPVLIYDIRRKRQKKS